MTSMNVPEPVMSLAVMPKTRDGTAQFSRALNRFTREDPTFKVREMPSAAGTPNAFLARTESDLLPASSSPLDFVKTGVIAIH